MNKIALHVLMNSMVANIVVVLLVSAIRRLVIQGRGTIEVPPNIIIRFFFGGGAAES